MTGTLYGVGVGPGDPELMTLKAARLIHDNEIIAVPGQNAADSTAYRIAVQAVPELAKKTLVPVAMPMTHDRSDCKRHHETAADTLERYLQQGQNVVFLTLGDPTIYSTYPYLQKLIAAHGYKTETISGIPSFCAAAARTNTPLVEWNELLHILPAAHTPAAPDAHGTYVLMKSGHRMNEVKQLLAKSGRDVVMVENCGMQNEQIYHGAEEIPDDAGYYSLIIAKEGHRRT